MRSSSGLVFFLIIELSNLAQICPLINTLLNISLNFRENCLETDTGSSVHSLPVLYEGGTVFTLCKYSLMSSEEYSAQLKVRKKVGDLLPFVSLHSFSGTSIGLSHEQCSSWLFSRNSTFFDLITNCAAVKEGPFTVKYATDS